MKGRRHGFAAWRAVYMKYIHVVIMTILFRNMERTLLSLMRSHNVNCRRQITLGDSVNERLIRR